jgi:hypothetical protein
VVQFIFQNFLASSLPETDMSFFSAVHCLMLSRFGWKWGLFQKISECDLQGSFSLEGPEYVKGQQREMDF